MPFHVSQKGIHVFLCGKTSCRQHFRPIRNQFMGVFTPPTLPPVTLLHCLLWVNGCTKTNRNLRLYYRRLRLYYRSLRLYYRSLRLEVAFLERKSVGFPQQHPFQLQIYNFFSRFANNSAPFVYLASINEQSLKMISYLCGQKAVRVKEDSAHKPPKTP